MYQTNLDDYDVLLQRITLKDSPNHVYEVSKLGKGITSDQLAVDDLLTDEQLKNVDLSAIDEYGYVKVDVTAITGEEHD